MARRRARRGPPTCQDCRQVIAWFHTPTGQWRRFDPKPVDARHHNGPPACPVENGRIVWRYRELVEDLMVRREISQADAEDEARDMPWYVPHNCAENPHPGPGYDDNGRTPD